jgi:hypothetical protein
MTEFTETDKFIYYLISDQPEADKPLLKAALTEIFSLTKNVGRLADALEVLANAQKEKSKPMSAQCAELFTVNLEGKIT